MPGGGPITDDVELSALLFIGFVAQWWVLLVLVHVVADQSYLLTKGVAKFLVVVYLVFLVVCISTSSVKFVTIARRRLGENSGQQRNT